MEGIIFGARCRIYGPIFRSWLLIVVILRALGFVVDRDMDGKMMDPFRPSLEEASVIQRQDIAPDFIGRR